MKITRLLMKNLFARLREKNLFATLKICLPDILHNRFRRSEFLKYGSPFKLVNEKEFLWKIDMI